MVATDNASYSDMVFGLFPMLAYDFSPRFKDLDDQRFQRAEMPGKGRPTPMGQAFAEYGRIAKTLHLLRVLDPLDDTYRRQMNRQLTVQESRHKLARDICHGKRGQGMQAYRTGQEDQLGPLGLVLNAAVLWTTRYLDVAVAQLRAVPAGERSTRSWTRTSLACPRCATRTSTAWAAIASARPTRPVVVCARCVTRPSATDEEQP
jgi:TnpA family transposase